MSEPLIRIDMASVKVMRSYDYCHFEISLTSSIFDGETPLAKQVDDLRKEAARLADKAIEQYKIAKQWASRSLHETNEKHKRLSELSERIMETPEEERTPEEKAIIKACADDAYAMRRYDYQDDWDQSY